MNVPEIASIPLSQKIQNRYSRRVSQRFCEPSNLFLIQSIILLMIFHNLKYCSQIYEQYLNKQQRKGQIDIDFQQRNVARRNTSELSQCKSPRFSVPRLLNFSTSMCRFCPTTWTPRFQDNQSILYLLRPIGHAQVSGHFKL